MWYMLARLAVAKTLTLLLAGSLEAREIYGQRLKDDHPVSRASHSRQEEDLAGPCSHFEKFVASTEEEGRDRQMSIGSAGLQSLELGRP